MRVASLMLAFGLGVALALSYASGRESTGAIPSAGEARLAGLLPLGGLDARRRCQSPFPATGQSDCWDTSGAPVACAGTGHNGEIQAGFPLSYIDNGNGTVTDLNTARTWEKKSDDGGIHDKDNLYTWADAFVVHVATLNAMNFAAHGDWRVPNVRELHSLVSHGTWGFSVAEPFDLDCVPGCTVLTCSCTESGVYHSSTSNPRTPWLAWFVSFGDGYINDVLKTSSFRVRAVRGGL